MTRYKTSPRVPVLMVINLISSIAVTASLLSPNRDTNASSTRPHIVFILADDLGYNDIGYHAIHGMSAIRTPHLDTLAAEGVKLENYYVQPICTPSRSAFMTGRYPIRYGLQHDVIGKGQASCLPLSEYLLPERLRELGYATHALGKWHLGICRSECLPTRRGFDSFFGYAAGGGDHFTHYSTFKESKWHWKGKDLMENETSVWGHEGEYSATLFTERAQNIIRQHDPTVPLFLYVAYKNVHDPLQAPDKYKDMNKHISDTNRHTYAAMVSALDEGVKNITSTLKEENLWNNTVLVFSSDNGGSLKNGGANNYPLRGGKWSLWEGGVKAAAFVTSPLLPSDARGTINREPMHISDWFSTFTDGIAGGGDDNTTQSGKHLDSYNQWNVLWYGQPTSRDEILLNIDQFEKTFMKPKERDYWRGKINFKQRNIFHPKTSAAIRSGQWKLVTGTMNNDNGHRLPPPESGQAFLHLLMPDVKQFNSQCASGTIINLFNMDKDPFEKCNVSQRPKNRHVVLYLLQRLQTYARKSAPVYYPEPDMNSNPGLHGGAWRPWLDDDLETFLKLHRFGFQPYM